MLNRDESIKRLCWEDRFFITDPKYHRMAELGEIFEETVSDSDKALLDALIAYKAADADVAGRSEQVKELEQEVAEISLEKDVRHGRHVRYKKLSKMFGLSRGGAPKVAQHGKMTWLIVLRSIAEPSWLSFNENESVSEYFCQEHSITQLKNAAWKELLQGELFEETVSDSDVSVQDKVLDELFAYKAADADVAGRFESKFIIKISNDILKMLFDLPLYVGENLVGVDILLDKLNLSRFVVSNDKVNRIGICGISGIGKTTLAKAIYNLMYVHFEGSYFCEGVREKRNLAKVQRHMIEKIMKTEILKISNVSEGAGVLKQRMPCKPVLLVLDDVDDHKQLNYAEWKEPLQETNQLQKMSLYDSQEQNKKKKQHYGSEKGFRHFVKSQYGDDFLSDEKVKETFLEELIVEQEWIKSHKCTECGLFYDMICDCQQELELDRPYLKRAKSAVSDGGGKNHNDDIWINPNNDIWSPPWEDPHYAY